mgnify:CR=1 FL=1
MLVSLAMSAQITSVTQIDKKVRQYDAVFFEVALTGEWENPYLQECSMELIPERTMMIPSWEAA